MASFGMSGLVLLPLLLSVLWPAIAVQTRVYHFLMVSADYGCKDMLPHHLGYYLAMGIPADDFKIVIHATNSTRGRYNLKVCEEVLLNHTITPWQIDFVDFTVARKLYFLQQLERMRTEPHEWIIATDVDEFVEFPLGTGSIHDFLSKANTDGVDLFYAQLADRLSISGELMPIDPPPSSLWNQFPLQCETTRTLLLGETSKVAAYTHKYCMHTSEFHYVHKCGDTSSEYIPPPVTGNVITVHKFKWVKGLREFLVQRRDRAWWTESTRLMQHLEAHGGRLCVECNVVCGAEKIREYYNAVF